MRARELTAVEGWQRASTGGVFDSHREYTTCTYSMYCLVTQSAARGYLPAGARALQADILFGMCTCKFVVFTPSWCHLLQYMVCRL
jgi:hypothetical protein